MPTSTLISRRTAAAQWLRLPWLPLAATVVAAVVLGVLDPPMRDLQAALARESANRSGVGVTYWFDWFGGVAPGSYSLLVPTLTSLIGSLALLCLCTIIISALAFPVSRSAAHPTLLTWTVSVAAVLNMLSGRVTFAVGAAIAIGAVWAFQRGHPLVCALLLTVSGLASPLVPAFAGIILVPFAVNPRYRTRRVWWALFGAALGVLIPYALFGAPGSQPYPWSTLFWSLLIGITALPALGTKGAVRLTPITWIIPVAMVTAIALFAIPTGVGSNLSRFFYLVLPCVVFYWSLKSPRMLALLLSPALVYALFVALYDQVTVAEGTHSKELYLPLTVQLDHLMDTGDIDNHRVELVDTGTRAGSHLVTDSVPLARGWENQSDMRYNPLFYEKDALDADSYQRWLADNAVAFIAVSADPIRQQAQEATLISQGLPYLERIWRNDDWELFRVKDPTPIVAMPLRLVDVSASSMTLDVTPSSVGKDLEIRIRPNRYLTATLLSEDTAEPPTTASTNPVTACLLATDDDWTVVRFDQPGRYTLAGQFSMGGVLEPLVGNCGKTPSN